MNAPAEPPSSWLGRAWYEMGLVFKVLTDLSFKTFITPRLVRLLYVLSLVGAGLSTFAWMISGFTTGVMYGCFTFITGPVAFFIYMLAARVVLEFLLAVFRIAEGVDRLIDQGKR